MTDLEQRVAAAIHAVNEDLGEGATLELAENDAYRQGIRDGMAVLKAEQAPAAPAAEPGLGSATFAERKAEIVRTIMRSGITKSERQANDLAEAVLLTAVTGERWDQDADRLSPRQRALRAHLSAWPEPDPHWDLALGGRADQEAGR